MGRGRRKLVEVGAGARTCVCMCMKLLLPRERQRLERLYEVVGSFLFFFVLPAFEHGGQLLLQGTVSISREGTQRDEQGAPAEDKNEGTKGTDESLVVAVGHACLLRTSLGEKHSFAIASRRRLPRAGSESFCRKCVTWWRSCHYRMRRRVQAR
jgi:hypothetical protein